MDLSTRYLGLALRNPLVASASPLTSTVPGVRRLVDAGVAAVPDPIAIDQLIATGWVTPPRSVLRDVDTSPAGHSATVVPGAPRAVARQ